MSKLLPADAMKAGESVEVLVIGAGACGLAAALKANEVGAEILVLERDASPSGSTSLSSGFVPAAPTRFQRALGIADSHDAFAADIQRKARGEVDEAFLRRVVAASAPTIEWLADAHGFDWLVLDDFLYPGHSKHRMHALPEKTGASLEARLLAAAERQAVPIATEAHATALYADANGKIVGLQVTRPGGASEDLACRALVLACNGYGGNPALVRRHIPEMAEAPYFGHPGNQGDAVLWGQALGAATRHLGGCQGHGSVAHPHGIPITWALMMEGGIQVNTAGQRFSNEHEGYSEQSVRVLAQDGGIAWNIYDRRLHEHGLAFPDYREAVSMGAIREAPSPEGLAAEIGVPAAPLAATLAQVADCHAGKAKDPFERDFTVQPLLAPPYHAVKVTGALFHTQGGLVVDDAARVCRASGRPLLPNLFAGGGAACGVSGPAVWGYLSGNGLLTALTLGAIAGESAAKLGRA